MNYQGCILNFRSALSASQQWHLNRANHATNTDPEYIVKDPEQEIWLIKNLAPDLACYDQILVVK